MGESQHFKPSATAGKSVQYWEGLSARFPAGPKPAPEPSQIGRLPQAQLAKLREQLISERFGADLERGEILSFLCREKDRLHPTDLCECIKAAFSNRVSSSCHERALGFVIAQWHRFSREEQLAMMEAAVPSDDGRTESKLDDITMERRHRQSFWKDTFNLTANPFAGICQLALSFFGPEQSIIQLRKLQRLFSDPLHTLSFPLSPWNMYWMVRFVSMHECDRAELLSRIDAKNRFVSAVMRQFQDPLPAEARLLAIRHVFSHGNEIADAMLCELVIASQCPKLDLLLAAIDAKSPSTYVYALDLTLPSFDLFSREEQRMFVEAVLASDNSFTGTDRIKELLDKYVVNLGAGACSFLKIAFGCKFGISKIAIAIAFERLPRDELADFAMHVLASGDVVSITEMMTRCRHRVTLQFYEGVLRALYGRVSAQLKSEQAEAALQAFSYVTRFPNSPRKDLLDIALQSPHESVRAKATEFIERAMAAERQ